MELTRRQIQIVAGIIALFVIAGVGLLASSLPSPAGPLIAAVVGLLSYRLADKAFDIIFGPNESPLPTGVDPMPRLRYRDEVKRRLEDSLNEPQKKEDFFKFPNARSFILSLPLIEQKDAELKKLEGKRAVLEDTAFIGDDFKAQAARPRVEVFVEHAVEEMTLPEGAKRWGVILPEGDLTPHFSTQIADSRLGAIRGGYASILIHLYSCEHWVDISKTFFSHVETREEFHQKRQIEPTDVFGRQRSAKEIMKDMARREEEYDDRIGVSKILREFGLGIDKMKGTIEPAFEKTFPNQLGNVAKTADSYIKEASDLDKSLGMFGAFAFSAASTRSYQELGLVLQEIERLRKVFSKDESVLILLNSLKEEHRFMLERMREVASKNRGLPF